MSRSSLPTFSISWSVPARRSSSNFLPPASFSAMNSRANSPDWISPRISFIAAREASPITRLAGVVPGLDQGLEAGLDQLRGAAAEHCLLTEEVGLALVFEGGLDHRGAAAA